MSGAVTAIKQAATVGDQPGGGFMLTSEKGSDNGSGRKRDTPNVETVQIDGLVNAASMVKSAADVKNAAKTMEALTEAFYGEQTMEKVVKGIEAVKEVAGIADAANGSIEAVDKARAGEPTATEPKTPEYTGKQTTVTIYENRNGGPDTVTHTTAPGSIPSNRDKVDTIRIKTY